MRFSRHQILFAWCLTQACLLPINLWGADTPLPESMVTLRAQPAVFFVRAVADIELTVPESVDLNIEALKKDLSSVPNAGANEQAASDAAWELIFQQPGKYLVASGKTKEVVTPDGIGWSGSAFAISREGILLTNAHVASSGRDEPVVYEEWGALEKPINEELAKMTRAIGKTTASVERVTKGMVGVYTFYASRCRITSKFKSAKIVLDYKVDAEKSRDAVANRGVEGWLQSLKREEITAPVTVLAAGQTLPGKDVAVLKVTFEPDEQARLIRQNQQQSNPALKEMLANIQNDRLVCLSLGSVNDVLPQARVYSLGFPGVGFDATRMDPESQFKVSAKSGQISQTKRMLSDGGWDIFEMTAPTNHGDSGGPVLDVGGRVIGLNVGKIKATDETTLVKLAIPINIAQEMLTKLGIKPDPGQVSRHWEQSLRHFADGKYEAALQEVQTAIKIQKGSSLQGNREASWYLRDMAGRCLQKMGKIP